MERMRIYADFNGIEEYPHATNHLQVDLTSYGTLASLSKNKLKLTNGISIELFDPEGLMATGTVYFDRTKISKNCSGWFAYFDKEDVAEFVSIDHDFSVHYCFTCRRDIKFHLDKVGRQYLESCPFCGTSVMYPLLPP